MIGQDMPPPGGFASIKIEKTSAKPIVRQGIWAAILLGMTINGLFALRERRRRYRVLRIEQMEHYIAAQPFLYAEQERLFLNHLYTIREEERELMKDHPGWKVGTLYGERMFKTLPPDSLPPIRTVDYTIHRTESEFRNRVVTPDKHQ